MRRGPAGLLLALAVLCAACGSTPRPAVYGFYTEAEEPVAPGSWGSFTAHAGELAAVLPFWFRLAPRGDGRIEPFAAPPAAQRRALVRRAHASGVRVEVVVHNLLYPGGPRASRVVGASALLHPERLAGAIEALVAVEGYDGVHLDLEALPPSSRGPLVALTALLRRSLPSVTLSVPVPSRWSGAYDYAGLARAADGLVLMAYDEHTAESGPGPIASLPYVRRALLRTLRLVPGRKLILGLAAFGFEWPPGRYLAMGRVRAARVDRRRGAAWLRRGGAVAYFETPETWADKLRLARGYGLAGVAIWRLGMEAPGVWRQLGASPR